jgi:parallel beta-helix repeat protein
VANVEISGFIVDGFETGILLQNVVRSRVSSNEVRNNLARVGSVTPFRDNGVVLRTASFNEISENFSHDNGHMGISVSGGAGNIVRANRLLNNQRQYSLSCSLMLYAGATGNQVIDNLVENTAVTNAGSGIMLGPGGALQNLVAGNRIVGHPYAGVDVRPASQSNLILRNDASGNGLAETEPDLLDYNTPGTNLWIGNIGTCTPGNAGC